VKSSILKKYIICIFLAGLINLSSGVYAGVTHVVYGELQYSGGGHPASATWNAFITTRPGEVLHENSTSSLYNAPTGNFIIDCWAFPTNWQAGDILHVDFNDGSGSTGTVEITLTNDPQQYAGVVSLGGVTRQITLTTNPAGLQFTADGAVFTGPHTFTWGQGSVHTVDVTTPQSTGISGLIYDFTSWSDAGAKSHNYTVPGSNQTLTANFNSQAAYPSTPHIVGGFLAYSNGTHPVNPTWTAYITARPGEIITQDFPGSNYDGATTGGFLIQCAAFSQWAEGEILHADFSDGLGYTAFIDIPLTTNPGDMAGTVVLTQVVNPQITITTTPAGLQFVADGTVYTAPYTFTWEAGSTHSVDVTSPQASVQPGTQYVFASWSDSGAKAHNYVTPGSDQVLTITFATQYYLTISSVYGNPQGGGWYNSGVSAQFGVTSPVNGAAGTQYVFTGWIGSGAGSYSGVQIVNSIIMNNPVTETAGWKTQYQLTTTVNPAGSGTVTPNLAGPWYDAGVVVSLTATPGSGYVWAGWSGGLSGNVNPANLLMDAAKAVTANFTVSSSAGPELVYFYPGDSTYSVPRNTEFQFKVEDETEGVNIATLNFTVNGVKIIENGAAVSGMDATLTPSDKACTVYFKPASDFDANTWIACTMQCRDLATPANAMNTTVQFYTGPGSMIYAYSDTLDTSGGIMLDDSTQFALYLPWYALNEATILTMAVVNDYPDLPADKQGQKPGMYFGPAGLQFADSVTITIPFTPGILEKAGVTQGEDLPIYYYSMTIGKWSTLRLFDPNHWIVYANVAEFGYLVYGQKVETLSRPGRPEGQTDLRVNTLYGFETTAAHSSLGHALEYRFGWGDGSFTDWSSGLVAAHKWTEKGNFGIVAFARSKADTFTVTSSDTLHVIVRDPDAVAEETELPAEFRVEQNYPNPFNPKTMIRYQLPAGAHVTMEIYNISGQKIRTLVDEEQAAGYHAAIWDGHNDAGMAVAAGLYFMQIRAGGNMNTIRMALLK